jgi:hypothetical protein
VRGRCGSRCCAPRCRASRAWPPGGRSSANVCGHACRSTRWAAPVDCRRRPRPARAQCGEWYRQECRNAPRPRPVNIADPDNARRSGGRQDAPCVRRAIRIHRQLPVTRPPTGPGQARCWCDPNTAARRRRRVRSVRHPPRRGWRLPASAHWCSAPGNRGRCGRPSAIRGSAQTRTGHRCRAGCRSIHRRPRHSRCAPDSPPPLLRRVPSAGPGQA